MGKIWFPGGGGGADLDAVTAGAGDVLAGKVIVGADGEPLTGTLALSGTAADSQVLSGQTYYNTDAKTKRTGTMTNRGAWNGSAAMNGSVTIPAGYHNGSGKVTGPAITNRGAYGGTGNSRGNDARNSRVWVKIPGGYYNENANVYISYADLRNMLGVTADKIKKNVSILGLIGSFEGYVTSPLYLFRRGTIISGQSLSFGGVSDKLNGDHIEVYSGTYFNNFVDLTNYKFLKFVGKGTYRSSTMSLTIKNLSLEDVATTSGSVSTTGEKTFFIDISALNGLYQIYLNGGVRSGAKDTASYYEIYLSNI